MMIQIRVLYLVGYIKGTELQGILIDMGYYDFQKPYFRDFFDKIIKACSINNERLYLDDFVKVHNTFVEMLSMK